MPIQIVQKKESDFAGPLGLLSGIASSVNSKTGR